jgi:hypothetical protein
MLGMLWISCGLADARSENAEPDGTVSTSRNQATCLPLNACPAGTREAQPASPDAEPECVSCAPGHYCAGGKAAEVACAPGDLGRLPT